MVRVSVVTVVLNDKLGLTKTLDSLKCVDKGRYEHIIIDGKSTDGSLDVLEKFSERLDIVVSEHDDGVYDAMNKGALRATGDVVCFLNAGDVALEGYIDHPVKCFSENSDIDYCYAGVVLCGNTKKKEHIPKKFSPTSEYLQVMPFPHPGLFAKRGLFDDVGFFNLSKKITADHEWIVRVILSGARGKRIAHALVEFYLDGISLSHNTYFEMYQTAIEHDRGKWKAALYYLYGLLALVKYKMFSR